jgi:hypothetical protein
VSTQWPIKAGKELSIMNTPRPIRTQLPASATPPKGKVRFQRRVQQMREAAEEIALYRRHPERHYLGV